MKWLDKAIGAIAPKYAIRRMQVRQQINNYYEAAIASRLHATKRNSSDPDAVTKPAIESLRDQARNFEQNYDLGRGVLSVLVANTVGDGIKPIFLVKNKAGELHKDVNDALKKLYADWVKHPEVTGDFDYYSAQRILARSFFRDGEVLIQNLSGNVPRLDHGTAVPYSFEMIESDYLPNNLDDDKKGITQGIQKNAWGKAVSYFLYKSNPDSSFTTNVKDTKRIAASKILHLKLVDRIRQTRGVSIFASILNRIDDIKEIDENERVAARVAAAMAGYIRKGSPEMYVAPEGDNTNREMEFMPGMIFDDLTTGEEIGTINTTRPNPDLIPFRADQLKAVAAGVQASYSSVSKNFDGTYSSQRQELVEQYASYGIVWAYLKERMARPITENFINMAVASLSINLDDVDRATLYDTEYTRPPLTWIDPKKEMDAVEKEIAIGIVSRSEVIRRRGGDPEEVAKKIAEENKMYEGLGISFETSTTPAAEPASDDDDDDDELSDEDNELLDSIENGAIVKTIDGFYLRKVEGGYEAVK